jgi:hypothetical protein
MNIINILDVIWTPLDWQEGDIVLLWNLLDGGRMQRAELLAANFKSVGYITAVCSVQLLFFVGIEDR